MVTSDPAKRGAGWQGRALIAALSQEGFGSQVNHNTPPTPYVFHKC
jgi:hypothetical protein